MNLKGLTISVQVGRVKMVCLPVPPLPTGAWLGHDAPLPGQAPGSEYFAEIERRTDADSRAAA